MAKDEIRILIVEDSTLTATQLCELIGQAQPGVDCSVVATEREALAAIADTSPHVVVLDLHLKEGTGFGVLQKIPTKESKPVVIVMTNYALPKYRDLAMLAGADYFLDKAVSIDELPKILRSAIQKHS